jgi:hypothetical protein
MITVLVVHLVDGIKDPLLPNLYLFPETPRQGETVWLSMNPKRGFRVMVVEWVAANPNPLIKVLPNSGSIALPGLPKP